VIRLLEAELPYPAAMWISEIRIAFRGLMRTPRFALSVALTLGLGIGATTTIYAVIDGVMLRRLPYEEPAALVTIGSVSRSGAFVAPGVQDLGPISLLHYQHLRDRARSFQTLAAINTRRLMPLTVDGGEQEVPAHEISADLLTMLGAATPALGRAFLPEEYGTPREGAVMITYEEWQSRYGGDPAIIGRTIGRIRGGRFPAIVTGVLPRDFRPLEAFFASGERPGYYFPAAPEGSPKEEGWRQWYVLGRLRPGVSIEQARGEVESIGIAIASDLPDAPGARQRDGSAHRIGLNGLQAQTVGASGRVLGLFLGAAGLLLALASLNAAMLLVARSLERLREFETRMALGAGWMRIVRLVISEAGILIVLGGMLGTLLAYGGVVAFLRYAPASIPRLHAVGFDARVLGVAAAVSLGAGLGVVILAALHLARSGRSGRLNGVSRAFVEPASRLRTVLVGGQMTMAIVLLAGACLLFNSFVRIQAVEPGFKSEGLVIMTMPYKDAPSLTGLGINQSQAWDRILDELRAVPGVQSVAGTTGLPFQTPALILSARLPEDTPDSWRSGIAGYVVTPDYLETIGTRLLRGRGFQPDDRGGAERVALVNESFVRTQFGGVNPIDTVVRLSQGEDGVRIVGVVEDVIQRRPEEGFRPAIYLPHTQAIQGAFVVAVIRTAQPTEAIYGSLRAVSARLIPARQPQIQPMTELMESTRTSPRFQAILIGAFAVVATLLAAAGLYAAMAHFVSGRRRELGIRIALGENRSGVVWRVFRRGLRLTTGGLVVGLIATMFLTRALKGFLYEIEPNDPATLLAAMGILVLVAAGACLAPALRATAVDPVVVLKEQ
jgi:putative ABC transport system permease protein